MNTKINSNQFPMEKANKKNTKYSSI